MGECEKCLMRDERGLTLVEMLAVISIMLILLSISTYSVNCVLKENELGTIKESANELSLGLNRYEERMGFYPLGERLENDLLGIDKIKEELQVGVGMDLEDLPIYEIDFSKLNLEEKRYKDFLIIDYGEDENFRKFNGTLILREEFNVCGGSEFITYRNLSRGKFKVSESLNYEVSDEFIRDMFTGGEEIKGEEG